MWFSATMSRAPQTLIGYHRNRCIVSTKYFVLSPGIHVDKFWSCMSKYSHPILLVMVLVDFKLDGYSER
jgi:hypothetical protein